MGSVSSKQIRKGTPLEECLSVDEEGVSTLESDGDSKVSLFEADARNVSDRVQPNSVDLIVTSPPYWRKRDYGFENQIGQESTAEKYVDEVMKAMSDWKEVLRPTGSIFFNIGDTYHKRSLAGIPGMIEKRIRKKEWYIRNRFVWIKRGGMPDPAKNRLAPRHEFILFVAPNYDYYFDLYGYSRRFGNGSNPGDVLEVELERDTSEHLAPYPDEIVERAVTMACPHAVCSKCGQPRERIVERTAQLDPSRPQARRAMEIAKEAGLTCEHIQAIQATGISDAGKAKEIQNGTGRNSEEVKELASEAKEVLGGYFREFTFAKRKTTGWTSCDCDAETVPGTVLDPFMGTGTTLETALRMGRSAIGVDLKKPEGIQHNITPGK